MFWTLEARGRDANTHLLTLSIVAARRRASWGLGTRGDVWVVRFRRPKFDISAHRRREQFVLQSWDWEQYAYMIEDRVAADVCGLCEVKRYKNRMVNGKVCEGLRLCRTARRRCCCRQQGKQSRGPAVT